MLDDSDIQKISDKIETDRKKRLRQEDKFYYGFLLGAVLFGLLALGVSLNSPSENQITNLEQERFEVQDMSCEDLKHYTPKYLTAEYATLELLQRCY